MLVGQLVRYSVVSCITLVVQVTRWLFRCV